MSSASNARPVPLPYAGLPATDFRDRSRSVLVAIGAVLLFAAVGVAWLEPVQTGREFNRLIIVEAIANAVVALAPVWFRLRPLRRFDPFEPSVVFGAVHTMVFTVRPLFLISSGVNYAYELSTEVYRYLVPSPESIALAMLYGLLGIICFQVGYARLFRKAEPDVVAEPMPWSSRRVTHVAIFGTIMAVVSAVLIFPVIGSLNTLLSNFGMIRGLLVGYGYQSLGIDLLPLVILIVFVDFLQGTRRPILVVLILFSNVYNLVLGSRAGVFNVWFFLLLAFYYMKGLQFTVRRAVLVTVVLLVTVVYSVSTADLRNTGLEAWSDIETTTRELWSNTAPGMIAARTLEEFNQVDVFATLLDVGPRTFPFEYGKTYIDLLLQPIPRMLWPGKPWSFDIAMGYYATGERTAIPPSMIGEMYINFHVFGIVAGMLFFGWGCRRTYQILTCVPRTPAKILAYALLLPYVPIIATRSFVGAGTTIAVLGISAWAAVRYISVPDKPAAMRAAWQPR